MHIWTPGDTNAQQHVGRRALPTLTLVMFLAIHYVHRSFVALSSERSKTADYDAYIEVQPHQCVDLR